MPRNRRKTLFLALGLVCVLIAVCVIFWRHSSREDLPPGWPDTNGSQPELTRRLTSTPKPLASSEVLQRASVTSAETPIPNPQKDAVDVLPINSTTSPLLPPGPAEIYRSGSRAIVVVDVERLLAELLPEAASPDTRAQTIRDIQRATSRLAAAHHLDLVFDRSGQNLNHVPVISSAAGVTDLTEEVRHELNR